MDFDRFNQKKARLCRRLCGEALEPRRVLCSAVSDNRPETGVRDGYPSLLWGDFDQSGRVDGDDLDLLIHQVAQAAVNLSFDFNRDGHVNTCDVDHLILDALDTVYGDVNFDGLFDERDLVAVFQVGEYEDDRPKNSRYEHGDWNGDRDFTSEDFVFVFRRGTYSTAAPVFVISEIVAANDNSLLDEDGDSSDWIEIHNTTSTDQSLAGWQLTDDRDEPTKWSFPNVSVPAFGFLTLFASGKNRTNSLAPLHTSFRLRSSGEYLGLLDANSQVVHEFAPQFPSLEDDTAFGLPSKTRLLFSDRDKFKYYVPTPNDTGLASAWTQLKFDDSAWQSSSTSLASGVGMRLRDVNPDLKGLYATDLTDKLRNSTLLIRQPFYFHGQPIDALTMRLNLDDGFVAFINGQPIASFNAPSELSWNSKAKIAHSTHLAIQTHEVDLSKGISQLRPGWNLLGIHVLNYNVRDLDLLFRAELVAYRNSTKSVTAATLLSNPSPGLANRHPQGPLVQFDQVSGQISEPFALSVSATVPTDVIRFTTDGSQPNRTSPVYTQPIPITGTTLVQAYVDRPGLPRGDVSRVWFTRPHTDLNEFSSDLPLFVFDNFNARKNNDKDFQFNGLTIFEPDLVTGRSSFQDTPVFTSDAGLRIRGNSTATRAKTPYALELWDWKNRDQAAALLGLPADADWALTGPLEFDRAFIRNTFTYELSRQMGRYAPRTRFVEVFHNRDGGDVAPEDYVGLYFLIERIKRGTDRVDIQPLRPNHNSDPEITGGWILKRDLPGPGESGFQAGGVPIYFVEPKEVEVTGEQQAWIAQHIDKMAVALKDFNPETGYHQYIDVDSWIDHHLLRLLTAESDSLGLSTYFHMDRSGKIAFGPLWDSDRSMGADRDGKADDPEQWHFIPGKMFAEVWWRDLFQDPKFRQRWINRWFELRQTIFHIDNINQVIDQQAAEVREAQVRNFQRWPNFKPVKNSRPEFEFSDPDLEGWEAEISHLRNWLIRRINWLDAHVRQPPID